MTLASVAAAIASQVDGDLTAVDLLNGALNAVESLDDPLASVVAIDEESAMAAAQEADEALAAGVQLGPLHGVPVALKDIIDLEGVATRCGSPAYPDAPALADAPIVARLREAGAVVFGKTVSHELACGVYSDPAGNPWDPERIPGGSSGGSGAAVAAGITPVALGSDTGGSIRIPAALCGVAGMKPTFGLVPKSGVAALSWSLDHIGPLGRTVADCAVTLGVLAGHDPSDPTSLDVVPPNFSSSLGKPIEGVRVGIVGNHFHEPIQDDVADAFAAATSKLGELGCELIAVEIPNLEYTLAAEFGIVGPEAAAYHRNLLRDRPDLIDPGIRALLVAGRVLPTDSYLKARTARELIRGSVRGEFDQHRLDVVVTPQLPATAAHKEQLEFAYEDGSEDVTSGYVRTTAPFNLTGQPALSIPCGFDRDSLPIGLQIAGRPLGDSTVLQVGHAYEQATDWHLRRPPIHAGNAAG